MNKEIKEIKHILHLLHAECNPKAREEDINYVIDYITNLQENNDNQMKYIANLLVQITNLQQEYDDSYRITAIEYKKRIYKAIEYINQHKEKLHHSFDEPDCDYWIATNPDDLLNILQNGSEENERKTN